MATMKKTPIVSLTPSEEEKALQSLSEHSGWKILTIFIQELFDEMDSIQSQAIMSGLPREEIGENAIVLNMTKSVINRVLNKVSDAKETIEKINE